LSANRENVADYLTSLHYSKCSSADRNMESAYATICSSTNHCWNAIHIWNRCCWNSRRISLWTLTV